MSNTATFKKKFLTYALSTIALLIAGAIYMGVKHKLAEPAGGKCEASTKCRGNSILSTGLCLEADRGSYCTHDCSSASDCPSDLACEAVGGTWTTETTRGNHASQTRTSQGTKMLCVRPTPATP